VSDMQQGLCVQDNAQHPSENSWPGMLFPSVKMNICHWNYIVVDWTFLHKSTGWLMGNSQSMRVVFFCDSLLVYLSHRSTWQHQLSMTASRLPSNGEEVHIEPSISVLLGQLHIMLTSAFVIFQYSYKEKKVCVIVYHNHRVYFLK
jgi:hypothetical protein